MASGRALRIDEGIQGDVSSLGAQGLYEEIVEDSRTLRRSRKANKFAGKAQDMQRPPPPYWWSRCHGSSLREL